MSHPTVNIHDDEPLMIARVKGASYALVMLLCVYLCSVFGPVGWLTYLLSFPAVSIILITVIARVNDMGIEYQSAFWNVRRMGLVFTGLYAGSQIFAPFAGAGFPLWRDVIMDWGVACTLMTSPHLPPWWVYVSKHAHVPLFKAGPGQPKRRASDSFDT